MCISIRRKGWVIEREHRHTGMVVVVDIEAWSCMQRGRLDGRRHEFLP